MKVLCALFALFAGILAIENEVALVNSTKVYHVLEGENLLVTCNVVEHPDIFVYWTKNDTKNPFTQNGTNLMILSIRRTYTGDFVCHAINKTHQEYNEAGTNVTVEVIHVDVIYPAEVSGMYSEPQVVLENATLSINCNMQGNPDPSWVIRNNDTGEQPFSANIAGDVSLMYKVSCDSSGYWVCTGRNRLNHGHNVTKGFLMTVHCPPRPRGNIIYLRESSLGKTTSFVMEVDADPRPIYRWSRIDDKPLRGFQTDSDHSTILQIDDIQISDFGDYKLTMSNEYGEFHCYYHLGARGYPQTPTNFRYSDITDASVTLYWTSGFDMGSHQHFMVMKLYNGNTFAQISGNIYDDSTTHGVGQNWKYVLRGLSSNTFYNLTVVSENQVGMSGFASPYITFWTRSATPDPYEYDTTDVTLPLGISLGVISCIATLAFLVYILKWRKLKTSYASERTPFATSVPQKK